MGRKSKGLCRAENCAVQARQREDESIDIADKYKAVQNIIQNKAAKWSEIPTGVKEGPDTKEIWLQKMSYLKHPSRNNTWAQF